tara:strand:- start:308 stop:805 length:498 start_codon:yes stop_codon:yes gene_type:complete
MKKILKQLTLVLMMGFPLISIAQDPPGPKPEDFEKIKAQKVSYITSKLELTPEEAQQFWPVYNEFDDKMHELFEKNFKSKPKPHQIEELTDEELEKQMEEQFEMQRQELALKEKYHKKYLEILSVKKVAMLYRAEHEFRFELMKRMERKPRGDDKDPGQRPPMDH